MAPPFSKTLLNLKVESKMEEVELSSRRIEPPEIAKFNSNKQSSNFVIEEPKEATASPEIKIFSFKIFKLKILKFKKINKNKKK